MIFKKLSFLKTLAWRALPWLKQRLLNYRASESVEWFGLGIFSRTKNAYIIFLNTIQKLKMHIGVIFHTIAWGAIYEPIVAHLNLVYVINFATFDYDRL
jgi:hypothetical protein